MVMKSSLLSSVIINAEIRQQSYPRVFRSKLYSGMCSVTMFIIDFAVRTAT